MKKLLIVLFASLLTTGCASAIYAAAALSRPRHDPHRHQPAALPSPVGRWDNVMMLEPGTPLKVLMMDGALVTGRFVSATNRSLRLGPQNIEALAMADVMRVDRVGTATSIVASHGAKGAVLGAGLAGVAGLIAGVAPPPRVFAGTALIGGYMGAADAAREPGPGTIYLAPSPTSSGKDPEGLQARTAAQPLSPTVPSNIAPELRARGSRGQLPRRSLPA